MSLSSSTPLNKVLAATANLGPQESASDGSFMVVCPAHADANPSLHVSADHSGKIALHCFKGCDTKAICYAMAMTVSELFPDHGERSGDRNRPVGGKKAKNRQQKRKAGGFKKFAEYEYRDADNVLVYKAIEYRNEAGKKDFTQCRTNGNGGWIENMRGVDKVPYCLPELIATPKDQIVFIAEGEKKVNSLRKWGFAATCNVGGAGSWNKDYSKYLRDRAVIVLPDNDPVDPVSGACPGMDFARKVISCNDGIAKLTRILTLPGLPEKGDIIDWIAAGGTKGEFDRLVVELMNSDAGSNLDPAEKPANTTISTSLNSSEFDEKLLSEIHLGVLGEIEGSGGKVKVFSEDHRKTDIIADIGRLSYERLLQVCGPSIRKTVHLGTDDIPGIYTLKDVKQAIAVVSGKRRVGNDSESGCGIWRGISSNYEPNDSVILVGSGEAAKWNGNDKLEKISKPLVEGRILDFGGTTSWYQHDELESLIQKASDISWSRSVYSRGVELFERWSWKHETSGHVIVNLILASFIQTLWDWRPQVAIVGETNTGKSVLFDVLSKIFGNLCLKSSGSSAAGIRQAIKQSAIIALCDEFDSTKYRQDILDMIRLSSRGDSVLKGTASHKGQEFVLRHIVWLAGIDSGLQREPDRNRFITLELIPPPADRMGQLKTPPDAEIHQLGQELLAIAIRNAIAGVGMARELKREQFPGFNQRVVESHAPLAAMSILACGEFPDPKAFGTRRAVLEMLLQADDETHTIESDKDRLLSFIFSSPIDCGHGERATVCQAISKRLLSADYLDALERNGFKLTNQDRSDSGEKNLIFLAHAEIKRKILKGSEWESANISQILRRIEGAESAVLRLSSVSHRGYTIPRSHSLISEDSE